MATVTEQLIPTPEKSPAARAAAIERFVDLQSNPLGTQAGESFGMPTNYVPPPARVYVINRSKVRKWKRLVIAVSPQRGAEEALNADKQLREVYNVDTLIRAVEQGKNMNRYKTEIHPVPVRIRVPGGPNGQMGSFPGRDIVIPVSQDDENPIAVEVPEGTWDLYLGNYDRMRGFQNHARVDDNGNPLRPDPKVQQDAQVMLSKFWQNRHNPVFGYKDDGEFHDLNNPYGMLEFVRVTSRVVNEPIDKELLSAMDIVEV